MLEPAQYNSGKQLANYAEKRDTSVVIAVAPVSFVFVQCHDVGIAHVLEHSTFLSRLIKRL
jgi:Zn-dependent M16 (insulinase) family peptidase